MNAVLGFLCGAALALGAILIAAGAATQNAVFTSIGGGLMFFAGFAYRDLID